MKLCKSLSYDSKTKKENYKMNGKKLLYLLLAVAMLVSLAACNGAKPAEEPTVSNPPVSGNEGEPQSGGEEQPAEEPRDTMVYATATFGQKFSPFFATTAYDMEVVDLVCTTGLLPYDRGGAMVLDGMNGTTRNYNGTEYPYEGMANCEIVQNDDGSVDYNMTMRDDIVFSDGKPADIDDVIFGIYVRMDPTYDGSSTLYALPITGVEEYRSGMDSRGNAIFADGENGYTENDKYTEDQYNEFWAYYNDQAGADFAQEIVDYCISNGYNSADDSVAACAANWGYELEEGATAKDFWDAIVAAYDTVEEAEEVETAGSTRLQLTVANLGEAYQTGVETGESAPNIAGIIRTGDYTMTVHMDSYDATAIYEMAFGVNPLHYYGDEALYDYANNSFGFKKGDLSGVKAKTTVPLGVGPYTFEGYANGVVTLKANPNYYKGKPAIEYLQMKEAVDSDYVPGTITGTFDFSTPSINDATLKAIKDANSNDELTGDVLTTYLIDYRGYGYLGINADLVNINNEPASDASKALRKGFMTLFAVYRDTVINSYYGDRASVIQYPISNTSWAAPQPADEGYRQAYSLDVDGNQIYDPSMSAEQRYAAAREAAIGYFKAAGFTYDEEAGKFTDAAATYEIMIPGSGEQDHPAYGVAIAASEVLEELGIKLQVNDVVTSTWNNAIEGNTAMMWAAAWQASLDPDMTQVYRSDNAHGKGTNSNHYSVDDADLDALIDAGRASADTEERKSIYRDAMDIIMDWGCELPLYQRKNCYVASSIRVDNETMPKEMTPFHNWYSEIEALEVK